MCVSFSIGYNVLRLCVCLPLAQCFNLTTNLMGANSTKPLLPAGADYLAGCPIGTLNRKTKRKKSDGKNK